jgi:exodeoxyribonuclease VII large subunit
MTSHFPNLLVPPTVLSVRGLTDYIQALLEQDEELLQVWITGEVSNASRHRSGLFFTLQDPAEQATLQCVVWTGYLEKLAILPEPGEQIIALGRIRLYPQRGQYQLTVWQVLPAGEGLRSLRYQQLRNRLEAEGLFSPEFKRPIPSHPQTIAVVTSPQAAAWGDIQRTLKSRYPGITVLLSPSLVQGEQAPPSIDKAIDRVVKDGRAQVLILSRGGGASEDLACFNDERVVRAIATCPIPIISGIGHQRDETLADLAADVCAHTPTAAAVLAVPRLDELMLEQAERRSWLCDALLKQLESAQELLKRQRLRLLRLQVNRRIERENTTLSLLKHQLTQTASHELKTQQIRIQSLLHNLDTLDPRAVLQRGYAVARTMEGKIARQAQTLKVGERLLLQLGEGAVQVEVTDLLMEGKLAKEDI